MKPEVLQAHLTGALALPGQDKPEFVPYVLCPGLALSFSPTGARPFWPAFSHGTGPVPAEPPGSLVLDRGAIPGERLPLASGTVAAARGGPLLGAADGKGRRLLFVAVLRTLGVPARLNPVDGKAQYWNGSGFTTVEAAGPVEPMGTLTVQFPEPLTYNLSWTLARWSRGWQTLDLSGEPGPAYPLPLGQYRLTTVNRLPNGNQLARFVPFRLTPEGATIEALRRQGNPGANAGSVPGVSAGGASWAASPGVPGGGHRAHGACAE